MKRILMIAAGGFGLLLLIAVIIPFLIPTSVYKGQIEKAASESLGVAVSIDGNPRLSLLPNISARVDGVEVANPEGFTAPHLLKAGVLRAKLQLWPLLSRNVVVDEITLSDLDLNIESADDGTYNIMVLAENAAGPPAPAPEPGEPDNPQSAITTTVDRARLRNAAISITGPDIATPILLTEFNGEARFTGLDAPIRTRGDGILNGQTFAFDVNMDTPQAALNGETILLNAQLDTDFFAIAFDGNATPNLEAPDATAIDGVFSLTSDQLSVLSSLLGDTLPPAVKLAKSIDVKGTASGSLASVLDMVFERVRLDTDFGTVSYTGGLSVSGGETLTVDGNYDLLINAPKTIIDALELDLPIRADALQRLEIRGSARGDARAPNLDFETASVTADGLDLSYAGEVDLSNMALPRLQGALSVKGDQLGRLLNGQPELATSLEVLGKIDASAKLSGAVSTLTLSDANLSQESDLLTSAFSGQISLASNTPLNGTVEIASSDPRTLLARLGNPLPAGDTLQNLSLKGSLGGTALAPQLKGMTLVLDEMTATGSVAGDFGRARPYLTANLQTDTLDLTPFMASDESAPPPTNSLASDWSDDTLDLAALKLMDGRLSVKANAILLDQITLNDAELLATLSNGRLSAAFDPDEDAPGFRAFDGEWSGDLVLDTSRATPRLSIVAEADSIAAQRLLGDLTGYTGLSGLGDVSVNLTSQGDSIKALVNGLDGSFNSDLNQGALSGINLAKMVRDASNLQGLLRSGDLTLQSFRDAISPEAETDFSNFIGNLQFNQGVATIQDLRLNNPVVAVIGSGTIDLGARTLDIRLAPSLDINAQGQGQQLGLNSIPIPVRISGSWAKPGFGFDTAAVQTELTRLARARAGSEISNRLGGDVGNIIGGIVGGSQPTTSPSTPSSQPAAETPPANPTPADPRSIEEELRDRAIDGAFGAIFGRQKEADEDDSDQ